MLRGSITAGLAPDFLYSQSDFYRGKTLRIVHGRDERMEINFVRPISIRHCAPDERAGRKSKSDSRAAARRRDKDLLPALVRARSWLLRHLHVSILMNSLIASFNP